MIRRELYIYLSVLFISCLVLSGCSAFKPPQALADRQFSGYFSHAGVLKFSTRIDGQAIQPGLSYYLPASWYDCTEGGKAPLIEGAIDQPIPFKLNKYVYKNSQLEFVGQPGSPHVLAGTLKVTIDGNNGPCSVGPIEWTAYPWPRTVQEATEMLLALAPEEIKSQMRNMPKEDLHIFQEVFGKWIRHSFGLADGNTSLLSSCGPPTMTPDECSAIIIEALWARINR